ncbi:RIO1 family regulatory kinase/ATPase domain-containing protein [Nakamurella lactea]|uniref:RIO1 family regulatory kinase/ATPase domain-containing protein n=1 Tax=Nakamurella lactea TaxID=459515 RepID=UPI0004045EEA|nr:RIO1 family regulatory kinase/ATPase [Nakamurella lactea]
MSRSTPPFDDHDPELDPDDPYTKYAQYDTDDDDTDNGRRRRADRPQSSAPRLVSEGRSGRSEVELDVVEGGLAGESIDEPAPLSSYDVAVRGPKPVPDWVVTDLNARDTRLGTLKSGKEADVGLLDRSVPGGPGCLLAVKTYRSAEHRMFHRDAGYLEGRRTRRSREMRAMAKRSQFGRDLLSGRWAEAEFAALSQVWRAGGRVPYPVQLIGSELMMEFLGDPDGTAAPRLAAHDGDTCEFSELWHDLVRTLEILAESGRTHGDLSPYNVLVTADGAAVIDLPQVVDLIANPQGQQYLQRDCRRISEFFVRRGVLAADADKLSEHLWLLATGSDAPPPIPALPLPPISSGSDEDAARDDDYDYAELDDREWDE